MQVFLRSLKGNPYKLFEYTEEDWVWKKAVKNLMFNCLTLANKIIIEFLWILHDSQCWSFEINHGGMTLHMEIGKQRHIQNFFSWRVVTHFLAYKWLKYSLLSKGIPIRKIKHRNKVIVFASNFVNEDFSRITENMKLEFTLHVTLEKPLKKIFKYLNYSFTCGVQFSYYFT